MKSKKYLNFSASDRTSKKILDYIAKLPREKNTNFIPINIRSIASELNKHPRTIRKHLTKLQTAKYIKKHKGKSNSLKIEILKKLIIKELTYSQKNILLERVNDCINKVNLTIIKPDLE